MVGKFCDGWWLGTAKFIVQPEDQLFFFPECSPSLVSNLMSDSFFASTRKRKKPGFSNQKRTSKPAGKKRSREAAADESDNDDQIGAGGIDDMELRGSDVESEEEIQETAAEKRIRLAKGYLEGIQKGLDGKVYLLTPLAMMIGC